MTGIAGVRQSEQSPNRESPQPPKSTVVRGVFEFQLRDRMAKMMRRFTKDVDTLILSCTKNEKQRGEHMGRGRRAREKERATPLHGQGKTK